MTHYNSLDPDLVGEFSYYTYKITSSSSPKYYLGVHRINIASATLEDCLTDGYFGSGGSSPANKFTSWKKKYKETLKKEILATFSTKRQGYDHEKELVGDLYKNDQLCLNSIAGGRILMAPPPRITAMMCLKHGETKRLGNKCYLCRLDMIELAFCEVHGESKHRKGSCVSCTHEGIITKRRCDVHGTSKFRDNSCYSCAQDNSITEKYCIDHGDTKHRGRLCCKCLSSRTVKLGSCTRHGDVLFRGKSRMTCLSQAAVSVSLCEKHGLTKHRGSSCYKCANGKYEENFRFCDKHGLTKHGKTKCRKCGVAAVYSDKYCPNHGVTKFRGSKCAKCSSKKTIHSRDHVKKNLLKPDCDYCRGALV